MIVGSYITGTDCKTGEDVAGLVLDKVRTVLMMEFKVGGLDIGRKAPPMPMPIDVYLVADDGALHLVEPEGITSIRLQGEPAGDGAPGDDVPEGMTSEEYKQSMQLTEDDKQKITDTLDRLGLTADINWKK
jgi:hypothetical protein